MAFVEPVNLTKNGITLSPLALAHENGLRQAAADGALWNLRVTSVPEPAHTRSYIEDALTMREAGNRKSVGQQQFSRHPAGGQAR